MKRVLVTGGSGFIGSELIEHLVRDGWTVTNFDVVGPSDSLPGVDYYAGSILDPRSLKDALSTYAPDVVIHLAARTDTLSDDVDEYSVNTTGTQMVVDAVRSSPATTRLVHTSTQYVAAHGTDVSDPLTFAPFTAYGESKARSEVILRESGDSFRWTIVRPTNIWGPKHPRYPSEFWRILDRGLYFHPGGREVTRTYGYVGTVASQIVGILNSASEQVDGKVFYLGDPPLRLSDWVDAFSLAITGRPARRVPYWGLNILARIGDAAKGLKVNPPLSSSRLHSMTADYVVPIEPTFELLGRPTMSLNDGVNETVSWLKANSLINHEPQLL